MLHCDEDDLSLLALGETVAPDVAAHLADCARCQSRLDQISAVVAAARSITDDDRPTDPPAAVWDAIRADLGVGQASTVIPLTAARSRRGGRVWLVAAAAAVVGVVAGGAVTMGLLNSSSMGEVVATATLAPIDESGFAGSARVEQASDVAVLVVSVPDLPAVADGYYEVWMATPDTSTMVAIGTLSPGEQGTFTLPAGMDVSAFPVVDVSVEHFDGNAGHSAVSVVRGELQA